jgi:transposase InsO family protein
MDFITDLPIVRAKNSILVVVDRLTKMAHFTPRSKSITTEETAQLILDRIVRLHGLPEEIVSDRGPQFASKFWRRFLELTFGYLQLSTPRQMDKRTEKPDTRAIPSLHCELSTGRLVGSTISSKVCL